MNSYSKIVLRSIRDSFVRFLAILSIIALGVGFFAGLKVTTPSFVETGNKYIEDSKMFDFRLISTIGFTDEDIDKISQLDSVNVAQGAYWSDVITSDNAVVRIHSITDGVNELKLESGRMPQADNELVVDGYNFDSSIIGSTLVIVKESNDSDVLDQLNCCEFTIVGVVRSPLYLNFQRGTTNVGSGAISYYAFATKDLFDKEYYEEAYVFCNTGKYIFSDDYKSFAEEYEDLYKDEIEKIEVERYDDLMSDAWEELSDARQEFDDERADAYAEIIDAQNEINDARIELRDANQELVDARSEMDEAQDDINNGYGEVNSNEKTINSNLELVNDGIDEIEAGLVTIASKREELTGQLEEAQAGLEQLNVAIGQLEETIAQIEGMLNVGGEPVPEGGDVPEDTTIPEDTTVPESSGVPASEEDSGSIEIPEGSDVPPEGTLPDLEALKAQHSELVQQRSEIESAIEQLIAGLGQLDTTEADLNAKLSELESNKAQLEDGLTKIAEAIGELREAQQELDDGEEEYADGLAEYNDGVIEFNDGVREYYDGLQEFSDEMGVYARSFEYEYRRYYEACDINPEVYVLGRDKNVGYVCFDGDSKIVDGVSKVFPIFFFAIAALVCSTTMQRMVSDERGQIGTMRAMGYSSMAVMMKYVIYSGSASLIGCVLGFCLGTKIFPYIIWSVYGMMYGFADITYSISPLIFVICLVASLLCSVGVTVVTATTEMKGMPAELIRPKAPVAGKRILFERIGFIWSKLPFLHKVSLRNIFRFKKRMWMMIVGIAGCTSLLITGFGINDSVRNIVGYQYDNVLLYDVSIDFDDDLTIEQMQKAIDDADNKYGSTSRTVYAVQENLTHTGSDIIRDVSLVVTDCDNYQDAFVGACDGTMMPWPSDGEVAVSSKLANSNNLKAGDMITFGYGDNGESFTLKIAYVFDNYIFHYAFMNVNTYEQLFEKKYEPNFAYICRFAQDGTTAVDSATDYDYAGYIASNNDVDSWSAVIESRTMFQNTMQQMNAVIWLVIICAAMLAFIVLFNLNNINITERVREIATLKVLGFNKAETGSYVFRENFILVMMGFVVGVPLGKALHAFVIAQIKMDTVTFVVQIFKMSYVYAFLLVMLFAIVTDLVMRRKIRKIDMAESLKSIE